MDYVIKIWQSFISFLRRAVNYIVNWFNRPIISDSEVDIDINSPDPEIAQIEKRLQKIIYELVKLEKSNSSQEDKKVLEHKKKYNKARNDELEKLTLTLTKKAFSRNRLPKDLYAEVHEFFRRGVYEISQGYFGLFRFSNTKIITWSGYSYELLKEIKAIEIQDLAEYLDTTKFLEDKKETLSNLHQKRKDLRKTQFSFKSLEILSKERAEAERQRILKQRYDAKIKDATRAYQKGNLEKCLEYYEEALLFEKDISNIESSNSVKDKIYELREQILIRKEKRTESNNLVREGDLLYIPKKLPKIKEALAYYEKAAEIDPTNDIALRKARFCKEEISILEEEERQRLERERIEKEKLNQYNKFIANGDQAVNKEILEDAITAYTNALKLFPSEDLRIKLDNVKNNLQRQKEEEAQRLEKADSLVRKARDYEFAKNYELAVSSYTKALALDLPYTKKIEIESLKAKADKNLKKQIARNELKLLTTKRKPNWMDFETVLIQNNITCLYHFTDRSNLESIKKNGGLFSWYYLIQNSIPSVKGGDQLSRKLDSRYNLEDFVRLSFTKRHPMMFIAKSQQRIQDPVVLEIDLSVAYLLHTRFSDMNATKTGHREGPFIDDLKRVKFNIVKKYNQFQVDKESEKYYQAEIMIKRYIPLDKILNIEDPIPFWMLR